MPAASSKKYNTKTKLPINGISVINPTPKPTKTLNKLICFINTALIFMIKPLIRNQLYNIIKTVADNIIRKN